jgi:plasmid stabilization system protein ParE
MSYCVILTDRAQRDRDKAYLWYRSKYSIEYANRWYEALCAALDSLASNPLRCGHPRDDDVFEFDVRELLIGERRKNHRALFRIDGETVVVLHIRHTGQRDLEPGDL